jgi:hypothetical protein
MKGTTKCDFSSPAHIDDTEGYDLLPVHFLVGD